MPTPSSDRNPNRAHDVFLAATELPPDRWPAFLAEACGSDADLHAEVERLLAAHAPSDVTGMHTPEPATSGDALPATGPVTGTGAGMVLAGRYTLVEEIGVGGMGAVWVARQTEPVKRRVAVKLIKTGMDSRAMLSRFEAERQALALMDHPNIAKVFDGGVTPDGRPFFVMELVNGVPLNQFCDKARLTSRERLELFVPICHAVQHAHQKGIVHRDLKPSNILVTLIDGKPVPKVIDFGVAKAVGGKLTDESLSTEFGAVVGTLEYMSPEQAGFSGVDVDTRADIYSLGVILYEALTGLRPIDAKRLKKAALVEMIRIIQEEEPSKPSTRLSTDDALPSLAALRQTDPKKLMALLRGELDWVVMKCLEKQRDRRYETANGLARDIQRYLADEPVEARPTSAGYRLGKFLRRHRGPVLAVCLLLVVLLGGIIGTSLGLVEARAQTRVAVQEAEAKEEARRNEAEQRELAEQANKQAYEALKSFTDELMEKVLGGRTQLTVNEKSILQSAQKQWEVFARSKGDSREARVIRSDGAENLALVQSRLGMSAEAEANHRVVLELRTALAADFPDVPRYRMTWASGHQNLGGVLRANGKPREAEEQFGQAVSVLDRLVADVPDVPLYRSRLAESQISLGNATRDRGDLAKAGEHYRAALTHQEKLVADQPEVSDYRWSLARSHWGLAFLNKRLEKWPEGEGHYRKAIDICEELAARFPAVVHHREDVGSLRRELGNLLSDSGNPAAGVLEFPRAIESQAKLAADFPSLPLYRVALARSQRDYGHALDHLKKRPEAEEQLGKAEVLFDKLVADNPGSLPYRADLGLTYFFRAELLGDGKAPAESLTWYDKAIQILTAAHVQNPQVVLTRSSLSKSHAGRADTLDKLKRHAEARKDWDRAVDLALPEKQSLFRSQRADSLLRSGMASEAVAEVAELIRSEAWNAGRWYGFACIYAVASDRIAGKRTEYAGQAMELLQKAVKAGYKDAAHMAKDTDLDPLRDREDFKRVLSSLQVK